MRISFVFFYGYIMGISSETQLRQSLHLKSSSHPYKVHLSLPAVPSVLYLLIYFHTLFYSSSSRDISVSPLYSTPDYGLR